MQLNGFDDYYEKMNKYCEDIKHETIKDFIRFAMDYNHDTFRKLILEISIRNLFRAVRTLIDEAGIEKVQVFNQLDGAYNQMYNKYIQEYKVFRQLGGNDEMFNL